MTVMTPAELVEELRTGEYCTSSDVHMLRGWAAKEIERLATREAEARWLLNHAVTRETVAEWTRRRDAWLGEKA